MDSPVFGSSNRNAKMFKANTNFNDPTSDLQHSQQILALLTVQKNIRKIVSTLNRIAIHRKRESFNIIRVREIENEMVVFNNNQKQVALLMEVERKLNSIYAVMKMGIMRTQMAGLKSLLYFNMAKTSGEDRKGRVDQREEIKISSHRGKKRQDLKQNSSENVTDLPGQNKKLKSEIHKQQLQEQSFISKMMVLLDAHQKEKPKGQPKKKK